MNTLQQFRESFKQRGAASSVDDDDRRAREVAREWAERTALKRACDRVHGVLRGSASMWSGQADQAVLSTVMDQVVDFPAFPGRRRQTPSQGEMARLQMARHKRDNVVVQAELVAKNGCASGEVARLVALRGITPVADASGRASLAVLSGDRVEDRAAINIRILEMRSGVPKEDLILSTKIGFEPRLSPVYHSTRRAADGAPCIYDILTVPRRVGRYSEINVQKSEVLYTFHAVLRMLARRVGGLGDMSGKWALNERDGTYERAGSVMYMESAFDSGRETSVFVRFAGRAGTYILTGQGSDVKGSVYVFTPTLVISVINEDEPHNVSGQYYLGVREAAVALYSWRGKFVIVDDAEEVAQFNNVSRYLGLGRELDVMAVTHGVLQPSQPDPDARCVEMNDSEMFVSINSVELSDVGALSYATHVDILTAWTGYVLATEGVKVTWREGIELVGAYMGNAQLTDGENNMRWAYRVVPSDEEGAAIRSMSDWVRGHSGLNYRVSIMTIVARCCLATQFDRIPIKYSVGGEQFRTGGTVSVGVAEVALVPPMYAISRVRPTGRVLVGTKPWDEEMGVPGVKRVKLGEIEYDIVKGVSVVTSAGAARCALLGAGSRGAGATRSLMYVTDPTAIRGPEEWWLSGTHANCRIKEIVDACAYIVPSGRGAEMDATLSRLVTGTPVMAASKMMNGYFNAASRKAIRVAGTDPEAVERAAYGEVDEVVQSLEIEEEVAAKVEEAAPAAAADGATTTARVDPSVAGRGIEGQVLFHAYRQLTRRYEQSLTPIVVGSVVLGLVPFNVGANVATTDQRTLLVALGDQVFDMYPAMVTFARTMARTVKHHASYDVRTVFGSMRVTSTVEREKGGTEIAVSTLMWTSRTQRSTITGSAAAFGVDPLPESKKSTRMMQLGRELGTLPPTFVAANAMTIGCATPERASSLADSVTDDQHRRMADRSREKYQHNAEALFAAPQAARQSTYAQQNAERAARAGPAGGWRAPAADQGAAAAAPSSGASGSSRPGQKKKKPH